MSGNGNGVNILSKVDKSLVSTPKGVLVKKSKMYDWTSNGEQGTFMFIDKKDLNIDGQYQRDQVTELKVLAIASKWDWLLVGTISVIEREDGSFWVFDGGHRTRAAFYRADISLLPCMVHKVASVNDEAKAFVARNTMTSNVSAFDRFRASVCAQEPIANKTNEILREFGLIPTKGGTTGGKHIICVGTLQKCVAINAEDARKVMEFCLMLAGDAVVTGKVLEAMFVLHQRFKNEFDVIDRFGDKLLRHSQREIEIRMNQLAAECGKGGAVVCAKALLDLINHKVRNNRIEW